MNQNRRRKLSTDVTCSAAIEATRATGKGGPSGACANSTGAALSTAKRVCAKLKCTPACDTIKRHEQLHPPKKQKKTFQTIFNCFETFSSCIPRLFFFPFNHTKDNHFAVTHSSLTSIIVILFFFEIIHSF